MSDPSNIQDVVSQHRPALEAYESLYKHFHTHGELTFCEQETAKTVVSHLKDLKEKFQISDNDFVVHESIGGHGVAATLSNGQGQTVMLRADMDALPIHEQTGLEYASTKRMKDHEGAEQYVMHACGHDMHITSLIAAAETLFSARSAWSGTLVLLFQPAEEKGAGAQAMVDDGLYTKKLAPIPDVVLGGHVMPLPAGKIGTRPKAIMAAADAFKVTFHGQGGHASQPHHTCDPITLAAYTITRLQTLVSREVNPADHAVVTVASLHAGSAENIIPESAEMKVNVRTFSEDVRKKVLNGIHRIVNAESTAHNAPTQPVFATISKYPVTFNDPPTVETLHETMSAHFGDSWTDDITRHSVSEDFSILASSVGKPSCFWFYGGMDPEIYRKHEEEGAFLPSNHSAFFAPIIQPTLKTAVDGYVVAALTWLAK